MKLILKHIFVILAITLPLNSNAQSAGTWTRGVRLGCDLSRLTLPFVEKGRKAFEFSIDTEIKPNIFPIFETGLEWYHSEKDYISYKSSGYFGRIGYDKNFLKRQNEKYYDAFSLGFRYGYANVKEQVLNYTITDSIWGNQSGGLAPDRLNAHWFEVIVGVKAQVINNFYLGFSMGGRFMIYSTKNINYPHYWPGYGNGANKSNFGFHYTLYYQIPLMKVAAKPKIETEN